MEPMIDRLDEPFHLDSLRALDRGALRRLLALLEDDSEDQRETLKRDLSRVPLSTGSRLLGQLVAICDTDRAARLETLRGIRDALGDTPTSGLQEP